jgi:SAM-dependent methyltransferase
MVNRIKKKFKRHFFLTPAKPKKEGSRECPVCGSSNIAMRPLDMYYFKNLYENQYIHNIFYAETINFPEYSCSICGAADRARLYAIYFKQKLLNKDDNIKLLDIAPDNSLRNFIKTKLSVDYRSADLFMEDVDDRVDICDMKTYGDNLFDIFICSHVLEHIEDDAKAIAELYRVLKPGGWGIVMVPILLNLENTYENSTARTPEECWKHFGQDDHVRAYSKKDFVKKLEAGGFKVSQLGVDYFGQDTFEKYAIHPRSVLYIAAK